VHVSDTRALCWSAVHLPLIGSILWVGEALSQARCPTGCPCQFRTLKSPCGPHRLFTARPFCSQLISPNDEGSADAWGLVISFSFYLGCATLQQLFHHGIGSGRRRVGKRRRMAIRCVFIPLTVVLHVLRQV